jgi:hypothetical protein
MVVCVCLSGADARVVEGRATLFRHLREVGKVQIPDGPPMDVVSSRKEKEEERVGGRRKYPGAPPHNIRKKERKKQADRKVPDRPGVMKRERLQKKKVFQFSQIKI